MKIKAFLLKHKYLFLQLISVLLITISILLITPRMIATVQKEVTTPISTKIRPSKRNQANQFIIEVAPLALANYQKYGILPSITIGQAILESDFGQSSLASNYHNYFGIKSFDPEEPSISLQTQEYIDENQTTIEAPFRTYQNMKESFDHHGLLLGTADRYRKVRNANNYLEAADFLYQAGYATDPKYPQKLQAIIEKYELTDYDDMTTRDRAEENY